jgi:hypothetical protein
LLLLLSLQQKQFNCRKPITPARERGPYRRTSRRPSIVKAVATPVDTSASVSILRYGARGRAVNTSARGPTVMLSEQRSLLHYAHANRAEGIVDSPYTATVRRCAEQP